MLENVGTAFRKFLLVIVVILAAALFVSVLTVFGCRHHDCRHCDSFCTDYCP